MPGPIHRAADVAAKHVGGIGPCRSERRERTEPEFPAASVDTPVRLMGRAKSPAVLTEEGFGHDQQRAADAAPHQRSYQPPIGGSPATGSMQRSTTTSRS
jgi:hypothetical protein